MIRLHSTLESYMAEGNNVSRRGFASMSPEKQREIAAMEPDATVRLAQAEPRMNCFTRGGGYYRNQGP